MNRHFNEGILKIKGKGNDVANFLYDNLYVHINSIEDELKCLTSYHNDDEGGYLSIYSEDSSLFKLDALDGIIMDDSIEINWLSEEEIIVPLKYVTKGIIDVERFKSVSIQYNLSLKIYSVNQEARINQDIEVCNGKVMINKEISECNDNDFLWNSVFPLNIFTN